MWSLVWELLALLSLQEVKKWIGTFASSISFISHPTKIGVLFYQQNLSPKDIAGSDITG